MTRRSLVVFLVLLLVMAVLIGIGVETQEQNQPDRRASTFNVGGRGLRAVYHTLRSVGVSARRWRWPYAQLPDDAGVLVIAAPVTFIGERAWRDDVGPWIAEGRTLILASGMGDVPRVPAAGELSVADSLRYGLDPHESHAKSSGVHDGDSGDVAPSLGEVLEQAAKAGQAPASPRAVQPTRLTPAQEPLAVPTFAPLYAYAPAAAPLYADDRGPYAWHMPYHNGHIILTASSAWLSNAHVAKGHNLEFLLRVLHTFGNGRTVLFDERAQGYALGDIALRDLLAHPAWSAALLQLLCVGVWYALSNGRRFGKPLPLVRDTFRSTLEYVDAMANLYRRAGLHRPTLGATWQNFRVDVAKRYGIEARAPVSVLRARLHGAVPDVGEVRLDETLETVRVALRGRGRLSDRELTRAARAIHRLRKEVL